MSHRTTIRRPRHPRAVPEHAVIPPGDRRHEADVAAYEPRASLLTPGDHVPQAVDGQGARRCQLMFRRLVVVAASAYAPAIAPAPAVATSIVAAIPSHLPRHPTRDVVPHARDGSEGAYVVRDLPLLLEREQVRR